jgi:hypothetical protein
MTVSQKKKMKHKKNQWQRLERVRLFVKDLLRIRSEVRKKAKIGESVV